jgi:integrase
LCSPDSINFVEPIRDRKKIAQIKNLLRGQRRFRNLLLFTVGVNTALRISDLLQLQIGQFLDDRGRYKNRFWIHEQKRKKRHEVVINQSIREALKEYLEVYPGVTENFEHFVFFNTKTIGYSEPIKRGQA